MDKVQGGLVVLTNASHFSGNDDVDSVTNNTIDFSTSADYHKMNNSTADATKSNIPSIVVSNVI